MKPSKSYHLHSCRKELNSTTLAMPSRQSFKAGDKAGGPAGVGGSQRSKTDLRTHRPSGHQAKGWLHSIKNQGETTNPSEGPLFGLADLSWGYQEVISKPRVNSEGALRSGSTARIPTIHGQVACTRTRRGCLACPHHSRLTHGLFTYFKLRKLKL